MPVLSLLNSALSYFKAGKEIYEQVKAQIADGKETLGADEQKIFDELENELEESRQAHQNLKDALEGR